MAANHPRLPTLLTDRMRLAPGTAAIGGLCLQRPAFVFVVVISDLHDDSPIVGFHRMQLVVARLVALPEGNLSQPFPRPAIIFGLTNSNLPVLAAQSFSSIEQTPVPQQNRTVRTVYKGRDPCGPRKAAIRRTYAPLPDVRLAFSLGKPCVRGLPSRQVRRRRWI